MTQTFDLNKMGLAPMSNLEMQGVDGGWALGPILVSEVLNAGKTVGGFIIGFFSGLTGQ